MVSLATCGRESKKASTNLTLQMGQCLEEYNSSSVFIQQDLSIDTYCSAKESAEHRGPRPEEGARLPP